MSTGGESRASKRRRKDKDRCSGSLPTPSQLGMSLLGGATSAVLGCKGAGESAPLPSLKWLLQASCDYGTIATDLMRHLVGPTDLSCFYSTWWKKAPFVASRGDGAHFKGLLSKKGIEKCTDEHALILDKDIGIRKFDSTCGAESGCVMTAKQIWRQFELGFIVEILHPQKYFDKIWRYISLLEMEFGATIVPSVVVAPSGAVCFVDDLLAQHADTIVLQLAGSATWTLTAPDCSRIGSGIGDSARKTQERTQCGDTLYVPPEWRVSCTATVGAESVLCILRTNHNRSLLDISEKVATQSILKMVTEKKSINEPLPRELFSFMGVAHSENDDDPRRAALTAVAKKMMSHIISDAVDLLDAAADQLAKDFVSSRVPVPLSEEEERLSYAGGGRDIKLFPYSKLRMIRPGIAIVVVEDGHAVVYNCMENSRDPAETVLNPVEFELDDGPAIEEIIKAYPHGVTISDLPHSSEDMDDKVEVARALFREGFLMVVDEATKPADEGASDDDDCPF